MAKLVYWICEVRGDSPAYNIRAKSKKEAEARRLGHEKHYNPPVKHEIFYKDAFDLMDICLSEARGYEPFDTYTENNG